MMAEITPPTKASTSPPTAIRNSHFIPVGMNLLSSTANPADMPMAVKVYQAGSCSWPKKGAADSNSPVLMS